MPAAMQPLSDDSAQESPLEYDQLNALASRLERLAVEQVGRRQTIEERWLEDLRQYNGVYDDKTQAALVAAQTSQMFVNITRTKERTAESKLGDMLFPTDDKNWALAIAPKPALSRALEDDSVIGQDANGQPVTASTQAQMRMAQIDKRRDGMELEIDGQLAEASYPQKARIAIHDACTIGTGIIKGPIQIGVTRQAWMPMSDPMSGQTVHVLQPVMDPRPSLDAVDPWNFFPDMSVVDFEDCKFTFERRYLQARQLKKLAKDPFYLGKQIELVLKKGARASHLTQNPTSLKRQQGYLSYGDTVIQVEDNRFEAWAYHGPLTPEDLRVAGVDISEPESEADEIMGCVEFCGGIVIKAYVSPDEKARLPYQVFNWEKDESSIFGYGVPYRLRNPQRVLNSAWRMMLDNAALSSAPMIVFNKALVQPESDNDYRIKGRKVWSMSERTRNVNEVFRTVEIASHQEELAEIVRMAREFGDDESGVPLMAQGEQGPETTKTAQGMTLLQNNANVVTRATVKNYDDGITTPLIQAFYDWNMQNSPKTDIKDDFEVEARGSSVLLDKQLQAQNLMTLMLNIAPSPVFGPMTKALDLYRKTVQSMHLSADDIVLTDDEYKQQQAQQKPPAKPPAETLTYKDAPDDIKRQIEQQAGLQPSQQPAPTGQSPADVAQIKAGADVQKHAADIAHQKDLEFSRHQMRLEELEAEREVHLIQLASNEHLTLMELKAKLAEKQLGIIADRHKQAIDHAHAVDQQDVGHAQNLETQASKPKPTNGARP